MRNLNGGGLVLILAVMLSVTLQQPELVTGQASVPAMFVLGDSLVDVGNNNFLDSEDRADYPPYGIDNISLPNGRFSNGLNYADVLAGLVGVPSPPPFGNLTTTTGKKILGGINYASASAGILDDSGQNIGNRYSLSKQVSFLGLTLFQLKKMMSPQQYTDYLAKSLVVLVFGSNDYLNNYLMSNAYNSNILYSVPEFANLLLKQYSTQLDIIYSFGLRKVYIAGIGPLGCLPDQRASSIARPGSCVNSVNEMLGPFNQGLKTLVDQLNQRSPGATFVYGNTYGILGDILNSPDKYGFNVVDKGCCEIWTNHTTCTPLKDPCPNRSQYVFWDAVRPTQSANSILANRAFSGSPSDAYPVNVQQLISIH